jgi:hypothetical protein
MIPRAGISTSGLPCTEIISMTHSCLPANRLPDSEGPPDFRASEYTPGKIGTYPAPAAPTAGEWAIP